MDQSEHWKLSDSYCPLCDTRLRNVVLERKKVEGSHTGESIAEVLKATEEAWRLPVPIAVTDNASNEKKAFQLLGWQRFGCYGHQINLMVKNALSSPEVKCLMGKAKSLVTFFHQSPSATDPLKAKQRLLLDERYWGHKLIMDVSTRWNGILDMLQRLTEQIPAIMAVANDPAVSKAATTTIKNCLFSLEEQSVVERLTEVLLPFEKATTILSADSIPTMHKVLPVGARLCWTRMTPPPPPPVWRVKERLREQLDNRTEDEDLPL